MTYGIRTANDGTYVAITSGTEDVARFGGRNGDNSGQLAGFRNILINPRISAGINQRNVANWAAVAIGAYGYDRWKKVDASTITQIVEAGNYTPSTVYTLSGNATATQQVTSPASGHWTIPAISNLETDIQLEEGYIASKRERRPIGLERSLCTRYYERIVYTNAQDIVAGQAFTAAVARGSIYFSLKRAVPTIIIGGTVIAFTAAGNNAGGAVSGYTSNQQTGVIQAVGASGLVAGNAVTFYASAGAYIELSGVEL